VGGVQRNRSSSFKRVPARIEDALILAGLVALLLFARTGATAPPEGYRIGPGDVLKITVHGQRGPHEAGRGGGRWPHAVPADREGPGQRLDQTELEAGLCQLLGKDYLVAPQLSVTVRVPLAEGLRHG
jgi:hypothetical protein